MSVRVATVAQGSMASWRCAGQRAQRRQRPRIVSVLAPLHGAAAAGATGTDAMKRCIVRHSSLRLRAGSRQSVEHAQRLRPCAAGPRAPPSARHPPPRPSKSTSKVVVALGVGGLLCLAAGGYVLRDEISAFLDFFVTLVEDWGPVGYAAYFLSYVVLEVLAVPAIPLSMSAGAIFGPVIGTGVTLLGATCAATLSFLIARYVARDRLLQYAETHPRFAAIDKAIGRNGFRVVFLLRLSPLLPLAASNYLYGLTSVALSDYVCASALGMLPGTAAYVAAGHAYADALSSDSGGLHVTYWQVGAAVAASAAAGTYIARIATAALEEDLGSTDLEEELHL